MPNLKDIMRLKALLRPTTPPTEQQVAHMIAQRHAAMPTQHGGLGLPAANTPMDRAAAMGYDLPAYRGTRSNEAALYANTQQIPGKVRSGTGVFMSEDPATASTYAGNMGGNVMPLMVRSKGMPQVNAGGAPWSDIAGRDTNQIAREALAAGQPGVRFQNVADPGAHLRGVPNIPETANNLTAFNPTDVRSRFAAFDPLKGGLEGLMYAEGGSVERQPFEGELSYFKEHPEVGGMAAEDDKVIMNPYSKLSPKEKAAVRLNEEARIVMRNKLQPEFDLTEEQTNFLNSNTYKDASNRDRAATIAARILSGDPSAGTPTKDQLDFVSKLQKLMK